jgi:hypothetical protein
MRRYDHRLVRDSNEHPDETQPDIPKLAYETPESADAYVQATPRGAILVLPEQSLRDAVISFLVTAVGSAAFGALSFVLLEYGFTLPYVVILVFGISVVLLVLEGIGIWRRLRGGKPGRKTIEYVSKPDPAFPGLHRPKRITVKRRPMSWPRRVWLITIDCREKWWSLGVSHYEVGSNRVHAEALAQQLRELLLASPEFDPADLTE